MNKGSIGSLNLFFSLKIQDKLLNKCESPTGDALVPAKKGLQMFVKTIDGHDRITLCVHAHFQAHRVILSWPCIVVTRKSRNLVAKFRTKKVSLSYLQGGNKRR